MDELRGLVGQIEAEIDGRPNRVRHEMNGALIVMALRDDGLRDDVLAAAARIGPGAGRPRSDRLQGPPRWPPTWSEPWPTEPPKPPAKPPRPPNARCGLCRGGLGAGWWRGGPTPPALTRRTTRAPGGRRRALAVPASSRRRRRWRPTGRRSPAPARADRPPALRRGRRPRHRWCGPPSTDPTPGSRCSHWRASVACRSPSASRRASCLAATLTTLALARSTPDGGDSRGRES